MRIRAIFAGALLGCSIFGLPAATPIERSLSPSGQFVIYGGDAAWRGAVSALAERTKANLLAVLQRRDQWGAAIVVNLQSPGANLPEISATALRFSQTGSGLKLQVDLTISRKMDFGAMERELLRAILLEMIYRNQPGIASGATYVEPPNWLIEGLLALAPNCDRTSLTNALAVSERITPLDELLWERPELLDSAGRLLYRAYSFALVQLLIEGPDGHARMSRYIDNLSNASNDPLADLKAQFPVLASSPEKVWRSAVARLSSGEDYQLLTFAESERRLDELLRIKVPGMSKSADLSGFVRQKPSAAEKAALKQLSQALLLFAWKVNPVLLHVALEYQQIATLLARGKRGRVATRLARLQVTRQKLAARMSDIDDYMNWFEATQMESGSGNFTNYLKAADQSLRSAPKRRDPLSVYLDSLADQFED